MVLLWSQKEVKVYRKNNKETGNVMELERHAVKKYTEILTKHGPVMELEGSKNIQEQQQINWYHCKEAREAVKNIQKY